MSCDLRAQQTNLTLGLESIRQEDVATDLGTVGAECIAFGIQLRAIAGELSRDLRTNQAYLTLKVDALEKEWSVNSDPIGSNAISERRIQRCKSLGSPQTQG